MKCVGSFKISAHLLCLACFICMGSGEGQKHCNSGPEPLLILLECRALLLRKVRGGRVPAPLWPGSLESILWPQSVHFALTSFAAVPSVDSRTPSPGSLGSFQRAVRKSWRNVGFESPFPYIRVFLLCQWSPLISGLIIIILPRGYDKGHTFDIYSRV